MNATEEYVSEIIESFLEICFRGALRNDSIDGFISNTCLDVVNKVIGDNLWLIYQSIELTNIYYMYVWYNTLYIISANLYPNPNIMRQMLKYFETSGEL